MTNYEKYFSNPETCAKSYCGQNDAFHEFADWKSDNFETVMAMKTVGFRLDEIMECWMNEEAK